MLSDVEREALEDIRDNISRAIGFIDGFDLDGFLADDKTFYAATRCLEIISEASRRLPSTFKERFPQIPWKDLAGSGSIYRDNLRGRSGAANLEDDSRSPAPASRCCRRRPARVLSGHAASRPRPIHQPARRRPCLARPRLCRHLLCARLVSLPRIVHRADQEIPHASRNPEGIE
jgi:hypothetical protein